MTKPFKTIDEQIDLLESRGLNISNKDTAKMYLLSNNYYNLINCFGKYFIDANENYICGSSFEEIVAVHHLDKQIKDYLFNAIISAENHLRSIVAYIFCSYHKEPYAYLYSNNYNCDDIHKVVKLTAKLSKIINEYKSKPESNSIKHYSSNHGDVPLWILANYLDLGTLVTFYTIMIPSEKNSVAKEISNYLLNNSHNVDHIQLPAEHLETILMNMQEIRNIVAHNNKLIGFKCRRSLPYISELWSAFGIINTDPRNDVYSVIISLQCLLEPFEFEQLLFTLVFQSEILNKSISSIAPDKVLASYGFPTNLYSYIKKFNLSEHYTKILELLNEQIDA